VILPQTVLETLNLNGQTEFDLQTENGCIKLIPIVHPHADFELFFKNHPNYKPVKNLLGDDFENDFDKDEPPF